MKKLTTLKKHGKLLLMAVTVLAAQLPANAQSPTPQAPPESMKASLYLLNTDGSTVLADGNLTNYDDIYLDGLGDDAVKMNNFGENFGILRENTKLSIEQRKKVNITDTTFFCMWNMSKRDYQIAITTQNLNHPELTAVLMDAYLQTSTELLLNGINTINFVVNNDEASYAIDRFKIIYSKPTVTPPLVTTFSGFTVQLIGSAVALHWTVENENAMAEYKVLHSYDGVTFNEIQSVQPLNQGGSKSYNTNDANVLRGDHYYRIKGVGSNGNTQYTSILKVTIGGSVKDISIYPNPVVNRQLSILFPGQVSGKYNVILYSSNGAVQPMGYIEVNMQQMVQTMTLPKNIAPGIYRLKFIGPDNTITIKTINVL